MQGSVGLRSCGPTAHVQWLRLLSVFACIYIFCSFNYSIFEHLAIEEYHNDIAKSPYHDGYYHVQLSGRNSPNSAYC